ncbi:10341_t:CDS:10, partial [Funneliformis caledonium]
MNDNYKLQDNLMDKINPYFLSQDNSFSDWNKWNLVSFLEYVNERKTLSFSDKRELHRRFRDSINAILKSDALATMKKAIKDLKKETCSVSVDLFWKKVKTEEKIAVTEAEYQHKQAFLKLKNRVIESREREVKKDVNVIIIVDMKALSVLDASTTTSLSDNTSTALPPRYTPTTPPYNDVSTTTPPSDNASTAPPPRYTPTTPPLSLSHYTPTTPPRNASPPPSQNILKHSFDIYEIRALEQSVILHFEAKMQEYKPKKALSVEVMRILKIFNVISLEDLGKALNEVKIDYNNLDRDIIYLCRLFKKLDLPESWYNSHIIAPIFDDCLESIDKCEVKSFVQKLLDKKSRKKKRYDKILSFSKQFEFIYIETATTSILSKSDKDLSKLHNAIIPMFKHMVSTLLEKLLHEISSMPILCVQFSGASVE